MSDEARKVVCLCGDPDCERGVRATNTLVAAARYDWALILRAWHWFKRVVRTGWHLARHKHLPWWLRVMFVIGCIQIPVLPVDEIFLVAAVGITAVFYREVLTGAWLAAERLTEVAE